MEDIKRHISNYEILKRNKDGIKGIDKDYFFELVDCLIKRNKELEKIEQEHQEINGELRERVKELEQKLEEKDMQHELELIGKEEYTKEAMGEIIEKYYTADEECIPKSKIKEKIEELDRMIEKINKGKLQKYTVGEILLFKRIYEELLEE